jgi:uncharacterized protein YaaQ
MVPLKIIGDAPYTDPSLHRTRIDAAANPLTPLVDCGGFMKQKSTTLLVDNDDDEYDVAEGWPRRNEEEL